MFFSAATGAGIITANFRFGADKRLLLFGVIRYILIPILIHVFIPVLISARLIMVPVVIIVTFLAVLEMWKHARINVKQEVLLGPIILERGERWQEELKAEEVED